MVEVAPLSHRVRGNDEPDLSAEGDLQKFYLQPGGADVSPDGNRRSDTRLRNWNFDVPPAKPLYRPSTHSASC